jgi:hypothetical protein
MVPHHKQIHWDLVLRIVNEGVVEEAVEDAGAEERPSGTRKGVQKS